MVVRRWWSSPVLVAGLVWVTAVVASAQSLDDDRWCCEGYQQILGQSSEMHLGSDLASGGDWDGDGMEDVLAIGSVGPVPGPGNPVTTSMKILLNNGGTLSEVLEVTGIEVGWRGIGTPTPNIDRGMGSAGFLGDLDGDDKDDIAIGAPYRCSSYLAPDETGAIYILLSSRVQATGSAIDVHTEADIIITGEPHWRLGWAIDGQSDVNDDGIHELVIGAPGSIDDTSWSDPEDGQTGQVLIYYGSNVAAIASNLTTQIFLNAYATADQVIPGEAIGDRFGYFVRSMGDLDLVAGRRDQFLVGAIEAREQTRGFGFQEGGDGYAKLFKWAGVTTGIEEQHKFTGTASGNFHVGMFGKSAVAVPDLDSDGVADILIGAPKYGDDTLLFMGAVYAYSGLSHGPIAAGALQPSQVLFPLDGNSHFGWDLESVGDFNSTPDGVPDVAVGCPGHGLPLSQLGPCSNPATYGGLGGGQILVVSALPESSGFLATTARYKGDDADSQPTNPKPRLGWSITALDVDGVSGKEIVGGAMGASKRDPPTTGTLIAETGKVVVFLHP